MNEKSMLKSKEAKGTPKVGSRRRSYRPVQYGLVVTAFLASFMGTVWLQRQDASANEGLLAASTALTTSAATSSITAFPTDEPAAVPSAPVMATDAVVAEAPRSADDDQQESESEGEREEEEEEEGEEESDAVIVALPTPTATVPTLPTPTPVPTAAANAPVVQPAAPQTSPRAVARSRSSR